MESDKEDDYHKILRPKHKHRFDIQASVPPGSEDCQSYKILVQLTEKFVVKKMQQMKLWGPTTASIINDPPQQEQYLRNRSQMMNLENEPLEAGRQQQGGYGQLQGVSVSQNISPIQFDSLFGEEKSSVAQARLAQVLQKFVPNELQKHLMMPAVGKSIDLQKFNEDDLVKLTKQVDTYFAENMVQILDPMELKQKLKQQESGGILMIISVLLNFIRLADQLQRAYSEWLDVKQKDPQMDAKELLQKMRRFSEEIGNLIRNVIYLTKSPP